MRRRIRFEASRPSPTVLRSERSIVEFDLRLRRRARVPTLLSALLIAAQLGITARAVAEEPEAPESAADATREAEPPAGPSSPQELASQVNDPTAPITVLQLRDIYVPDAEKANGALNAFELQPVIPAGPFEWLPAVQLIKITMPFVQTSPDPDSHTGLGDLTVFDLATRKTSWGRWGIGPILVLPTGSQRDLTGGKYQAGPALGVIYTAIAGLNAGFVLQNPISFSGSSKYEDVNQLIVSPTLTYNMSGGWFVGLSDFNWTLDWHGGGALIPLGLQAGRVVRLGRQPVSLSVEVGRAVARPRGMPSPGWILGFEITPIFNFHLGPGERIPLRGR